MTASIRFYEQAGFDVRRYEAGDYEFVSHDEASVFDLDVADPVANQAGYYLTPTADEWHAAPHHRPSGHRHRREALGHAGVHPHRP